MVSFFPLPNKKGIKETASYFESNKGNRRKEGRSTDKENVGEDRRREPLT